MKQTAVEWLVEQMIERKFFAKDTPLSYTTLEHLTNQAKAMEKEEMLDFGEFIIDELEPMAQNREWYSCRLTICASTRNCIKIK